MRKFLLMLLLVVTSVSFGGLAQRKYEGEKMYVYAGITPYARDLIMTYIAPVLKERWGIDLIVEPMGSLFMLQKVLAMGDKPTVTICEWDIAIALQAMAMGLTAPINLELIPNAKDLYEFVFYTLNDEVHAIAKEIGTIGLLYNEEIFAQNGWEPPTSWYDLWRPELAGRVSITAPESTWGTALLVMFALLEGGNIENIEPAFLKLKTLLPNIHTIHTWSSELAKLMQLGDVWLGTTGDNMGPALRAQGLPVRFVLPKEGSIDTSGGVSLIKGAPYQDVAHDYLNLYFSLEYQLRRVLWSGITSPHRGIWTILSPEQLAERSITPETFPLLIKVDWAKIAEYRPEWIERFHKEFR
ncbi:MAG: extracellular solute-binding protein [Candidatus Methanomethyliaceae archaeon]